MPWCWPVAGAAAQQSELGGKVRSGQQVTIPATQTVPGDLVATGGQVTIAGTVTGDVLVAAGRTTIGELIFATGRMTMDGAVAGNVLGSAGNSPRGGAVAGRQQVNAEQPPPAPAPTPADRTLEVLRRSVSVLVVGVLGLWLLPGRFRRAAEATRGRLLVGLGVGLLGCLAVLVALVLVALVTVLVAIVLGLLGLGSLTGVTVVAGLLAAAAVVLVVVLAVGVAAPATVGLALGRLLFRGPGGSFLRWLGALALGVLVVVLVAAVPVAGGWLEGLLVLLGLGALGLTARPNRRVTEPTAVRPAGGGPG